MISAQNLANSLRILSVDTIQQANSGHPGMPLGMADIAQVLWHDFLRHNPCDPSWANRDRFVLSNGHGSALLYSLLHFTGYAVSVDDLKSFRALHSITPGHPEYGVTPGVDFTTGPLGQGLAGAVGMALAEQILAAKFNKPEYPLVDHYTYCFVGDGCLMEGISHECASLAAKHKLGKLIVFWDDNGISIDGNIGPWFEESVAARFNSYGWQVISVDGHNADKISTAINKAQNSSKPTLICCKTHIGYATDYQDQAKVHGCPLGVEQIAKLRDKLSWPHKPFVIPKKYYTQWHAGEKGRLLQSKWQQLFASYQQAYPNLAKEWQRTNNNQLPIHWPDMIKRSVAGAQAKTSAKATRQISGDILSEWLIELPECLGGSADLADSTQTKPKYIESYAPGNSSGFIHYGVREFAMAAIMNGLAVHGGIRPYAGTFLTFSDYARSAIRMSAMMQLGVIYVLTHDSIGLGEDGPTHQPVEHIASLRLIPNLHVWRPADYLETIVAWQSSIENFSRPSCLLLSRQALPQLSLHIDTAQIARGAYWLYAPPQAAEGLLIATGSELQLAVAAAQLLQQRGIFMAVVSMPCMEIFLSQDIEYQQQVLPKHLTKRCAIEAGTTAIWYQFVGLQGCVVGLDDFGLSAPGSEVFGAKGIDVSTIVAKVESLFN